MHAFYRNANVKELQRLCFRASSFPELAMSSREAYEALVANDVDYAPLEEVSGRISATLALIYPPGIGVIVPGEAILLAGRDTLEIGQHLKHFSRPPPLMGSLAMFESRV
jgi:arginine/lysine/ornithine decarboxylase